MACVTGETFTMFLSEEQIIYYIHSVKKKEKQGQDETKTNRPVFTLKAVSESAKNKSSFLWF